MFSCICMMEGVLCYIVNDFDELFHYWAGLPRPSDFAQKHKIVANLPCIFTAIYTTWLQYKCIMFYTPNFIHCSLPYSKQADEKSRHKRWKPLIDMFTCIWMMEGVTCYIVLLIQIIDILSMCNVFLFEYEYTCSIIHCFYISVVDINSAQYTTAT